MNILCISLLLIGGAYAGPGCQNDLDVSGTYALADINCKGPACPYLEWFREIEVVTDLLGCEFSIQHSSKTIGNGTFQKDAFSFDLTLPNARSQCQGLIRRVVGGVWMACNSAIYSTIHEVSYVCATGNCAKDIGFGPPLTVKNGKIPIIIEKKIRKSKYIYSSSAFPFVPINTS